MVAPRAQEVWGARGEQHSISQDDSVERLWQERHTPRSFLASHSHTPRC